MGLFPKIVASEEDSAPKISNSLSEFKDFLQTPLGQEKKLRALLAPLITTEKELDSFVEKANELHKKCQYKRGKYSSLILAF